MSWRDLLQTETGETVVAPWLGGRDVRLGPRRWKIEGRLPSDRGWVEFSVTGRKATFKAATDSDPTVLRGRVTGYLVGDRLVPSDVSSVNDLADFEPVRLIEQGLDRFSRVSAGRAADGGPLIFMQQEMPLGPEPEVQDVFLDQGESVVHIREVTPALEAAFRLEILQRQLAERRRREAEERRQREAEELRREERRRELARSLGDAAMRRELAREDFGAAARAALAIGGATYLDHRQAVRAREMVVTFRLNGRRFECTCDAHTLQIIDAGVCLTAEYNDPDFSRGTRGDTWLTLESLPPVILAADRESRLVVFRHVD